MKKIIATVLWVSMLFALVPSFSIYAENVKVEIYVAPNGDDNAAGTIEEPLATLDGARKRVDKIRNDGVGVNVYFRGGEYFMDKTVEFKAADSGTKDAPITYMAYADEKPVFSGAVTLKTEDFTPVKGEMYERLPAESRDYVGVVDLKKKGITKMTKFTAETPLSGLNLPDLMDEVMNIQDLNAEFYFNDRSMTLAEWPNGSDNWARIEEKVSDYSFKVNSNGRMKRWSKAENAIMNGYPRVNWSYVEAPIKGFDAENEILLFEKPFSKLERAWGFSTPGTIGEIPTKNKMWGIQNLIEELDIPGEFYLDYTDLKLYFYPPYSTVNVSMKLAASENILVKMNNTKYVTFKGITFEKNRNKTVELTKCKNISFLGCVFQHIASTAIHLVKDCYNVLVDGCDFISIGVTGVFVNKMSREKVDLDDDAYINLTPQNNTINNCHFYDVATQIRGYSGAVRIHGVGNSFTNNRIHEAKSGVVYWMGNDHKINNNEIYNVLKVSSDQGAVYCGRSLVFRGTEIAYNHFHDTPRFQSGLDSAEDGHITYIYNDDTQGGTNIHHNLFVEGNRPFQLAGGTDTKVYSNMIIQCEEAGAFNAQGMDNSSFGHAYQSFAIQQLPHVFSLEAYKKYENMQTTRFGWLQGHEPHGAVFEKNLNYMNGTQIQNGSAIQWIGVAKVRKDNLYYSDSSYYQMFNNPALGDYTIKEDYILPEGYEDLKDIKLEKIGLYGSETREKAIIPLSEFRLYSPYDYTENVDGRNLFLQWEASHGADEYIVEISLDKEFTKICGTYTVKFNYANITDLDNDLGEYYWRVKAVSKAQNNKEIKLNSDGVRVLKTKIDYLTDTKPLEETLNRAEIVLSQLKEGIEEGNIAYGATDNLKQFIALSKEILNNPKTMQTEADNLVIMMEKEMKNIGKTVVKSYTGIDEIISQKDLWINNTAGGGLSHINDGVKLYNTSLTDMVVYTNVSAPVERNKIFCFKMNVKIPDGAGGGQWQAIAFQKKEDAGRLLYSGTNYGYLFLIKNDIIEIQIWNGKEQRIVDTIPNSLPKGIDTDVKFGVLDFGPGQRIILEIGGVVVFDHAEYIDLLREDLYFSIYDSPKTKGGINCGDMYVKLAEQKDVPEDEIKLGKKSSLGDNDLAEAIRSMSGSDELSIANSTKLFNKKLDNNKSICFDMLPKLSDVEQGVVFRADSTELNEATSDYYKLSFKNNKIILNKNKSGKKQTLSIANTDAVKSGEWNRIKIYTCFESNGARVIVYAGDEEVINCLDQAPIKNSGYFGVFNASTEKLIVRP